MKINCISLSNQKFRIPDYSPGNSNFPAEADRIHHFRLGTEKCPIYLNQGNFCNKNALRQFRKLSFTKQTRLLL